MKKKEFEKLKEMSLKDLRKETGDLKRKFVEVSAKIQAGREKNLKAGKLVRVRIAMVQTLISQKEKEVKTAVKEKEETK